LERSEFISVLNTRFSTELGRRGQHFPHSNPLKQADARSIAVIGDSNDARHVRELKDKVKSRGHCVSRDSTSLAIRTQAEANLRKFPLSMNEDANVADNDVGTEFGDANLCPIASAKEWRSRHPREEILGVLVRLSSPSLIEPNGRVPPVSLKRCKVGRRKTSQRGESAGKWQWGGSGGRHGHVDDKLREFRGWEAPNV
jgi:hypothetical protein